jgi:TonB family protein
MTNSKKYFWLALLGHLLLLFPLVQFSFFSLRTPLIYRPEEKQTTSFVPSYMFQQPTPSSTQAQLQKKVETSKLGTEKPQANKTSQVLPTPSSKLISDSSHPQKSRMKSKKTFDDPLLNLLHNATTEKLVYPKIAIDFNQSGVVQVGFVLSPSGQVTEIRLLKSSGFEILDNAAMDAVRAISPVAHVDQYLQKPRFIAAHIAFVNNSRQGAFGGMESLGD